MRNSCASSVLFLLVVAVSCSDDTSPADSSPLDAAVDAARNDSGADADAAEVVQTTAGPVKGEIGDGFVAFRGIPYAKPPVNLLRWAPPQPAETWTTLFDATQFSSYCPQLNVPHNGLETSPSEDCLSVTVWAPHPLPETPAPVMVWIHGGAFTDGGSSWAWTSGKHIAAKMSTVVVAFNYRLGPLGFLGHAALGQGKGNFGFLDQQLALKWVKDNISAFGGDPSNVTLFGHSAGSQSVCAHMASAKSKGLFHKAIMQSGPCGLLQTAAQAEAQAATLATRVGCDGSSDVVSCLRSKDVDTILNAMQVASLTGTGEAVWGPAVDGSLIGDQPMASLQSGDFNKVPLLIGSNRDEGATWWPSSLPMTEAQYEAGIATAFADDATAVLAQYPASAFDAPVEAAAAVLGDMFFVCPSRETARAVSAANVPTYLYTFSHVPSFRQPPNQNVYHNAMLWIVFQTSIPPNFVHTTEEEALSQKTMGYWTRFARSGDPNATGEVPWPKYEEATDQHLEIDVVPKSGSGLNKDKCDFWKALQ